MRLLALAVLMLSVAVTPEVALARIWSQPAWYVMIGKGTEFDRVAPIVGPLPDQAACYRELEEWLEMTDGTENVWCQYLPEAPAYDPHQPR